ncbi:hypothetical protein VIBNISO65_680014 [Vibrio nigripulchritudo SO65]|nr:hypothetical protein VIBNIAM115_1530015 [Vibrio nigripulchritudo AM115]CCN40607.1 hypothetical protein VIBNIFTn2_1340070 [Vibrio nigripulchritudo FTn2]CCN66100.1 hypothetical protein VIBNIPon4_50015 [Vibrio nigripulchritudo POn4]CCN78590.1 hypothetical protein VIBNISO65_680014 [Vibrio nigripulchritudo SO65]
MQSTGGTHRSKLKYGYVSNSHRFLFKKELIKLCLQFFVSNLFYQILLI